MVICILFFLFFVPVHSAEKNPKDARQIARAMEAHYHRATTLKAHFFEKYSDGNGGVSAESGTVYFSKPGRMRWEYESPEEKLFIVDGANVWFYVPADRTASRAKMGASSDWRTPLAFLTGKSDFDRLCRSMEIVGADEADGKSAEEHVATAGNTLLRCTPRVSSDDADQKINDVLLEADPDDRLVRVVIRQPGKLETEFRFGGWEENLPIAETKFHFVPPAGVAIVDEATLAGSLH
jgi:outer membrane lipoprotein carrier protein